MRNRISVVCLLFLLVGCHRYYIREVDPLTEEEIIELTRQGNSSEEIIKKIDASGTVYLMDSEDVIKLHEQGVDQKVIDRMLETYRQDLERRAYYRHPPPYHHYYPYYPHFGWHAYWW